MRAGFTVTFPGFGDFRESTMLLAWMLEALAMDWILERKGME